MKKILASLTLLSVVLTGCEVLPAGMFDEAGPTNFCPPGQAKKGNCGPASDDRGFCPPGQAKKGNC